jgi:hypothetical protein
MRSKEVREKGVYQVLDWVEAERPNSIKVFWNCVFRDHLLQQYPTLRLLRNRLLDGQFWSLHSYYCIIMAFVCIS